MKKTTIEDIAYLLYHAKRDRKPKPIVFLGAGASKSGNVPLANEIAEEIRRNYEDSPQIKLLQEHEKDYATLMSCLQPNERNKLLKSYVDKAQINVTHIYLAQLVTQGYIDYVLTVNFDNLMLRALALEGYHPPTYDLAILKDFTTAPFHEKSVLYLHGQHHGLWLLNTAEEMNKVKDVVSPILNRVTPERAWIIVGYSGTDPIFNHIVELGNFDNGLYWVGYLESPPALNVQESLLEKANSNSSLVEGYDSDSFFLTLNSRLQKLENADRPKLEEMGYTFLKDPLIFDNPFTYLKDKTISNIKDIDCGNDKEGHFVGVKERLEIIKDQVDKAINLFDKGKTNELKGLGKRLKSDSIKKEISLRIANKDFEKIAELESKLEEHNDPDLKTSLANLYASWGLDLFDKAVIKACTEKEATLIDSCKKFETAESIYSARKDLFKVYNNWGNSLFSLANLKPIHTDQEKQEKIKFIDLSIEKYTAAIELLKNEEDGKGGTETKIKNPELVYLNLAFALKTKAEINIVANKEDLLDKSNDYYSLATTRNRKDSAAFNNWGIVLLELANLKTGADKKKFLKKAEQKLLKAKSLDGKVYPLACVYALQGKKSDALDTLAASFNNKEITVSFVLHDKNLKNFIHEPEFKNLIRHYL